MIESNETSYLAIITISLPAQAQALTAHVVVHPSDMVETSAGHVKRLRDCTLEDLQDYAGTVEAEIWQAYQTICLADLAEQAEVNIGVELADSDALPMNLDVLMDHVLVTTALPAEVIGDATPVAETTATAVETDAPTAPEETPGDTTAAPPTEVAPAEEEHEPAITVAESEPVHEEREARPDALTRPTLPHLRILGKRRPLGHPTETAVDILINESPFRDAQAHALSSMDREVAGMLIGPPPEKQPDGRYLVHITDVIIARHTRMHGASVTYTPESWRYVNDKLQERYPEGDAVIVGWYHTHPGFGIFLSGMDQFIHQNFFTQIWHIALVLDPRARRSGFFCWNRQKSRVDPYEFPWPSWAPNSW